MKKLKIVFLLIFLLLITLIIFLKTRPSSTYNPLSKFPKCPSNLSGILTAPLIELKYITSIAPLGNLNPPGHTSPVDHNYFTTDSNARIPIYAPADSWITKIITVAFDSGRGFEPYGYVIQLTICDGLILDFANIKGISQTIKDEIAKQKGDCNEGPQKDGHPGPERQCSYSLNRKVTSGEEIGYAQLPTESDSFSGLQFEIWAANYNKPAPNNIDWSFYDDDRYAHIMCIFDLYTGSLKQQFYAKLGGIDQKSIKDEKTGNKIEMGSSFKPRTIDPICGTVNQNIVGTIQGMWFGRGWKTRNDKNSPEDIRQFSFLHFNIDPTYTEIGNAGEITSGQSGQLQFIANHSGTIDREPSEVKSDGKVYCYNYNITKDGQQQFSGKILTELVDDRHLKLEYQSGNCGNIETFVKPYNYER